MPHSELSKAESDYDGKSDDASPQLDHVAREEASERQQDSTAEIDAVRRWLIKYWNYGEPTNQSYSAILTAVRETEQVAEQVISVLSSAGIIIKKGKQKEFARVRLPELQRIISEAQETTKKRVTETVANPAQSIANEEKIEFTTSIQVDGQPVKVELIKRPISIAKKATGQIYLPTRGLYKHGQGITLYNNGTSEIDIMENVEVWHTEHWNKHGGLDLSWRAPQDPLNFFTIMALRTLRKKYANDKKEMAQADLRAVLAHELGHAALALAANILGDQLSNPDYHRQEAEYIMSNNEGRQLVPSIRAFFSQHENNNARESIGNGTDEATAYMMQTIEEPHATMYKLGNNIASAGKIRFANLLGAQILLILVGKSLNIDTGELSLFGNIHVQGTTIGINLNKNALFQLSENICRRASEAEIRTVTRDIYLEEFGKPIDRPPFAQISASGELQSRLQVPDELLKCS